MQKFALLVGMFVWESLSLGAVLGVRTPTIHLCFTELPVLAAVSDPAKWAKRYPAKSLPLSSRPYGAVRAVDYAARYHSPNQPRDEGFTPLNFSVVDYEQRLHAFASDEMDQRSLTYVSPLADGTRIKLHVYTGELLVVTKSGQVSLYTRLPVGQRSLAALKNTTEVFELLAGTQEAKARWPKVAPTFAKLTGGEAIRYEGFSSRRALADHVEKHVLALGSERRAMTLRQKATYIRSRRTEHALEFRDLRKAFLDAVDECGLDSQCEQAAYDALLAAYETRVEKYLQSAKPSILTYTQVETYDEGGYPVSQVTGYRFDVLTNEMAVFNRSNGHMLTYFRLDLTTGNRWLASHGYAAANSPLEYFLALVSCHRSSPSRQVAAQNCHPGAVAVAN